MIASWRGLGVLAAIALLLAVVLAVDLSRTPPATDRRLVHMDFDKVQRLAWGPFVANRAGDHWQAGDTTLDTDAVNDVL
ncbi:MAG TPA: hypothetical protein VLT45_18305, partial [Kofleriaceae bacterium]|nr:hypothetical protein [Kofleriaceae bacterium]